MRVEHEGPSFSRDTVAGLTCIRIYPKRGDWVPMIIRCQQEVLHCTAARFDPTQVGWKEGESTVAVRTSNKTHQAV